LPLLFNSILPPSLAPFVWSLPLPKTSVKILYQQWLNSGCPMLRISINPDPLPQPVNGDWPRREDCCHLAPDYDGKGAPAHVPFSALSLSVVEGSPDRLPLIEVVLGNEADQGKYYQWGEFLPASLLPPALRAAIVSCAPVPGTAENPLAVFVWTMRVVIPAILIQVSGSKSDKPTMAEKQAHKMTELRVKGCIDRGLAFIREVVDNKLRELETSPCAFLHMAPTHWHATLWSRYMHPLGEPWVQVATDPDLSPLVTIKRGLTDQEILWGEHSRALDGINHVLTTFLPQKQIKELMWARELWDGPWFAVKEAGGPYGALLRHVKANQHVLVDMIRVCTSVDFYWPFPHKTPSLAQTHSLAITAAAAVTALYIVERNLFNHRPDVSHSARVARAAFLPFFTDHLVRGLTDAQTDYLSDTWLTGECIYNLPGKRELLLVHSLWPDVDGVLTWAHLPNHQEVLFQLKMWSLTGARGNRLEQILDKATPFRSKVRNLGDILERLYNNPPPPKTTKEDSASNDASWLQDCEDAAAFRRLFNRMAWVSTQGLYARARPQKRWRNALYCHVAISRAGESGVVKWLQSGHELDEKWNAIPMAILREYLVALFQENEWYHVKSKKYFDFRRFAQDTEVMCNTMRDQFLSIQNAVLAVSPLKENTADKLVYRQRASSSLRIVLDSCRDIVKGGMMIYFAIRVDMLPRLRSKGEISLAIGHIIPIYAFISHARDGQITDRLAEFCSRTIAPFFDGEESPEELRVAAVKWLNAEPNKQVPHRDVKVVIDAATASWLKTDLCGLSVYLSWPISGQCTSNIWNFVSRQKPEDRMHVLVALTLPQLGGIEHETSKIVQTILLTDPIDLQPTLIGKYFAGVSLWDASVLTWWARHVQTASSVKLIARPACEVESVRHEQWKAFKNVYGERVAREIVRTGGRLGADNPSSRKQVAILPPNMWRVFHLPCCGKIYIQRRVKRVAYDPDAGCMVCGDGLPRRHSAGPASTDGNMSRIIAHAMNRMQRVKWLYGVWEYDAAQERAQLADIARSYAELVSQPYQGNSGRLVQIGKDYEKEIVKRITVCKGPILDEKVGGSQAGAYRTARTLTMFAAEWRAFSTGDASYCVPLADRHDVTMSCPRSAVCYGFWWAAEHQIVSASLGKATETRQTKDAFWLCVIPNPKRFIDPNLRLAFEELSPNMLIGGMGMSTKNHPMRMMTDEEIYKYVRSGPINLFTEQCVGMPVRSICLYGMRMYHASPVGSGTTFYAHCAACGEWYNEKESLTLQGLFVCWNCGDSVPVNRHCEAGACTKHDTERVTMLPLVFRDEAGSEEAHLYCGDLGDRNTVLRADMDIPRNIANAWRVAYLCPDHHAMAANWAQYWASYQKATEKLGKKDNVKKMGGQSKFGR